MGWTVEVTAKADRQIRKLPESIRTAYVALAKELEEYGPYRANWGHYGKLRERQMRIIAIWVEEGPLT